MDRECFKLMENNQEGSIYFFIKRLLATITMFITELFQNLVRYAVQRVAIRLVTEDSLNISFVPSFPETDHQSAGQPHN